MNVLAQTLNVLRGTLSRWLLPFDHNTRIDEQSSTLHSVLKTVPEFLQGKISDRKISYLVTGLNGVRKLIRVKIADDNDLEQARDGLQTIVAFFKELQDVSTSTANHQSHSMFDLLECRLNQHSKSGPHKYKAH